MSSSPHHRVAPALLAAATLAGAVAAPALAGSSPGKARTTPSVKAARGGTYGGSTSADTPIVVGLSRDGSHVTRLMQQFRGACTTGDHLSLFLGPDVSAPIAKNGTFAVRRSTTFDLGDGSSARETVTLAARVTGLHLRGAATFHAEIVDVSGTVTGTCDQAVTFRAVASAGLVFGGQTTARTPVVIELTGGGAKVHHFHIGWAAACTPSGGFSYGDTLRNFPVVAGRFGDRFADVTSGADGQTKLAYSVRGRISGAKATGSFRLVITHTGPDGAVLTCDTGAMNYRATSG